MKTKILVSLLVMLALTGSFIATAGAQEVPRQINYQGLLTAGGQPATGLYDLQFILYGEAGGGTAVAGPITNSPVGVTNGLFTTTLDFGIGVFTHNACWLEIGVRSNGAVSKGVGPHY